ncbi:hypothetical protein [Ornithinibacillus halotolerans]|uniref:DUF4382 domain-containing protein n=1 Tax=Ornithinibacillus halotolerans TaxID=1274357 RepID=A0A916RXX8_9BACI|nr:hypothetical protein [Ornithinibacillus halotolerans]GGA74646.1 hypothetical protein GCM10008025_17990 [Ornithinibacillus halotolerans]
MKRILLLICIASLFIVMGCSEQPSEKVLAYKENNEIIGSERDQIIGNVSDTIYKSIDRSNTEAEELIVGPIEGTGEDITLPEGRYNIFTAPSSDGTPSAGRVVIYDEDGNELLQEIFDSYYGVGSVTVDVNESHTIHFDGIEEAIIQPASTQLSTDLTTGIWEVGLDIEAGNYSVYPNEDYSYGTELAELMIFEKGKEPRLFEILNTSKESPINVELKDGQKIRVASINNLTFEPK